MRGTISLYTPRQRTISIRGPPASSSIRIARPFADRKTRANPRALQREIGCPQNPTFNMGLRFQNLSARIRRPVKKVHGAEEELGDTIADIVCLPDPSFVPQFIK